MAVVTSQSYLVLCLCQAGVVGSHRAAHCQVGGAGPLLLQGRDDYLDTESPAKPETISEQSANISTFGVSPSLRRTFY